MEDKRQASVAAKRTAFHIVFIEDILSHGVGRSVVPAWIVFVIELDGGYGARADVRAAPLGIAAMKGFADFELVVFHISAELAVGLVSVFGPLPHSRQNRIGERLGPGCSVDVAG